MPRVRQWVIGTVAAIALLGVAGAFAVHALVDPERLKRVAREKAKTAWSRDLTIEDARLQLWPLPALYATKVALPNAPKSRYPYLLQAESVSARIALLPLLTGKVRIKSIDIEGLKANIEVEKEATAPDAPRKAGDGELLDLVEVRVANADIAYRPRGGAATLWRIEEATVDADTGLRNVVVEASIARNTHPLKIKAELADLSRHGIEGAVTEGRIELDWGRTQATIAGQIPLAAAGGARGHAVVVDLKAASMGDMLAFFGVERRPRAPLEAHFESRESQGKVEVARFKATLGKLTLTGDGQLSFPKSPKERTAFNVRLQADRLDWAQTMLDAGGPVIPALESPELFHNQPLAWPLLVAMQGSEGKAEVKLQSVRLRNGLELRNSRGSMTFDGDVLDIGSFATELIGGSASGSLRLEGRRRAVRVNFDGTNLMLDQWFRERGSHIPFTGGPMKVKASFSSTGNSIREIAAGVTGPVSIVMGPGVWSSQKAGEAEATMVGALAGKESGRIELTCVGASMPFTAGRATAQPILGMQSIVSNLLTSGTIDLRNETIDVVGRIKARSGGTIGLSIIAGDIRIAGPIRAPKMTVVKTNAAARVGAAVATLGISLVGTAIADAADGGSDPCRIALGKG